MRRQQHKPVNYLRWLLFIVGGLCLLDLLTSLVAEGLWFQEVDYVQVFFAEYGTQVVVGSIFFSISLIVLFSNLSIARQRGWSKLISESNRPREPGHMRLTGLLLLTIASSLIIGIILLHHGQIAVSHWQPNQSLYSVSRVIPVRFRPQVIWQLMQTWNTQVWQPIFVGGVVVLLLIFGHFSLQVIAVLVSLSFGLILSEHWANVLLALHPTAFNQLDPIFGQDIGFYIFTFPIWELFEFWFIGIATLTFLSASLSYLLSGNSLSQGYFPGFSSAQQRHLCGLGSFLMLATAFSYWLDRYAILYSPQGVAYGATFTNVNAELPAYTFLSAGALILAGILLWCTATWKENAGEPQVAQPLRPLPPGSSLQNPWQAPAWDEYRQWKDKSWQKQSWYDPLQESVAVPHPKLKRRIIPSLFVSVFSPRLILYSIGIYIFLAILAGFVIPPLIQRLIVQPNELQLEQPFIKNTIALTRNAFNLDNINVEVFDPQNTLTYETLQENELTVENIRIWDTRPLLETNRQLQRIRLYYEFPDADIDRYTLPNAAGEDNQQQVLIAARELDYSSVPAAAQTWINRRLIYTHGYGFTVSPVNQVEEGGLPDYYVRGIEPVFVDSRVNDSIPIGKPRIYYGELTDNYVMTQTRVRELDYPSGSDNVYNTYDGRGGVNIGSFWRRSLFAKHLRDWRMILTEDFTPQTRVLFRRKIKERVRAIAPFLRYDTDPYLVAVDPGGKTWERGYQNFPPPQEPDQSYLYWIIDAYTINDHFPYSDPSENDFNYIRNSVKVVVDAYHGSVNFYVVNEQDPIINSWQKIFPDMFQPLEQMPAALRRHIRYAKDLYQVQSNQLMTYHMTDAIVFYNREDQWRAPNEIYGGEQQLVEPYFLIMNLPTNTTSEEFILLRPFTPVQRNNLIAWLAARSDGEQYGTMLLYEFPKQKLVYGPEQIEARINQDPVISQRISLWNRQGSRAVQGNLLVIPIEDSLLYVEPIYLEAEQNRLPTLARVIVVYGTRIAMAETLERALESIFQPAPSASPIVRPVEGGIIPDLEAPELEDPELEDGDAVPGLLELEQNGTGS
ncbi:MAG: hypothetical protein Kow00121_10980 [Elainellaceae cyanobacterium]